MLKRLLLLLFLVAAGGDRANAQARVLFEVQWDDLRPEIVWNIGVMDADGQNRRILTDPPRNIKYFEYSPVWSPGGRWIALTAVKRGGKPQVCIRNANGANVQPLTEPPEFPNAQYPAWSPGGSSLAFVVQEDLWIENLYRLDWDGKKPTNPKRLTQSGDRLFNGGAAWSPDGSKIAFTRQNVGKQGSPSWIYVMDASGGNEKQLTQSQHDSSPTWSPDGSRIAYVHLEPVPPNNNLSQLWLMDANGDNPHPLQIREIPDALGDLTDQVGLPLWLADGRILFRNRNSGSAVYVVNPDGSDFRQLLDLKAMNGSVRVTSWFDPAYARPQVVQPQQKLPMLLGQVKAATLKQNYPNPFNPDTWIPFELSVDSPVTLQIHDVQGHRIRTLGLGSRKAGAYLLPLQAAYWDGRNQTGQPVASGVYLYTLQVGSSATTRRMLLVK